MTYIKLEDVQKILNMKINDYPKSWTSNLLEGILEDMNSIPSINPEEMIEEMIEINRDEVYMEGKETTRTEIEYELLQELLQKFNS